MTAPSKSVDCASNVLSFALHLSEARRFINSDILDWGDQPTFRGVLRQIAEALDNASSGMAAAVTVCDLGAAAKVRSVETLTLANTAKELFQKAFEAPNIPAFNFDSVRDSMEDDIAHLNTAINRLWVMLLEKDFVR